MSGYRVLTRREIRGRLRRRRVEGQAVATVMSLDETTAEQVPFDGALPDIPGGWSGQCVGVFGSKDRERFAAATEGPSDADAGPDRMFAEILSDSPSVREERRTRRDDSFDVAGHLRIVVVDGTIGKTETLAHVSRVGAVFAVGVELTPNRPNDRETHARMPDGRRIAGIHCVGLPRCLLQMLAERTDPDHVGEVVRLPSQTCGFMPGMPTIGETRRRRSSVRYGVLTEEQRMRRVPAWVEVSLDDDSMRLAGLSRSEGKRSRRASALQARLPYPTHATNDAEVEEAVRAQLEHFDTDYLLSFDAVTALLASSEGTTTALDAELERRVVDMRFGGTNRANARQVERVKRHLQMLALIRIVVVPRGDRSNAFRGPILLATGENVDLDREIKHGDRIMLNPSIFAEMRKGRGVFVSPAYFRLDPYRDDWTLRLYRYLASRWSLDSVNAAERGWSVRVSLGTALDMSGIDWRTQAVEQRRGEPHARRRLEEALDAMRDDGMIGSWSIDGQGMAQAATLVVEVPADIRRAVEAWRPKVFAAVESGTFKPRGGTPGEAWPRGRKRVRSGS
jgi:hypothetical protein